VSSFAAALRPHGPANFLYADGEVLFAHGHRRLQPDGRIAPPGLHWLQRSCAQADETLQAAGLSVAGGYEQVLLLASVPLSDEPWQALAEGETVAVQGGALLARRLPPR
jgi:glutamine amidotransferase